MVDEPSCDTPSGAIAIIGYDGRFPQSPNPMRLWENLRAGRVCTGPIPEHRWRSEGNQWGGFLDDVDRFDAQLFRVSPKEAIQMDPQQRLLLEATWSALEHAGYGNHRTANSRVVGLYIGSMWHDYALLAHEQGYLQGKYAGPGAPHWSIANRISFALNLTGPSLAVDTACSSSLFAVHLACQSLLQGECEMAVAGGVNLHLHPSKYRYLAEEGLLSRSASKACFARGGDGYVPSEGVGTLLLKPLVSALRDGDTVHALIRGSAANHNGRGVFFKLPNSDAQARVVSQAISRACIDPRSIAYVEMSAFGSEFVDAAELAGLRRALGAPSEQGCLLGTLKPNLGHLEAASGIAQLLKVILQLRHRELLPSIFSEAPSADLGLDDGMFTLQRKASAWESASTPHSGLRIPRRAGVSSFGAGGSNVHVVLEEAPEVPSSTAEVSVPLLLVSAGSEDGLSATAQQMVDWLRSAACEAMSWADVAYTTQVGREAMSFRVAIVADSASEAATRLDAWLRNEATEGRAYVGNAHQKPQAPDIQTPSSEQLARAWAEGGKLDWSLLYSSQGAPPRRVPLPGHVFTRQSYWLGSRPTATSPANANTLPGTGDPLRDRAARYLKGLIGTEAQLPPARINGAAQLLDYGLESLMIRRLNAALERDIGRVSKTLFFDYATLDDLATVLASQYPKQLATLGFDAATGIQASNEPANSASAGHQPASSIPSADHPLYSPPEDQTVARASSIAIVGMSGRYPMANSVGELWNNLQQGLDCITEVPVERWDANQYYDPDPQKPGAIYAKWGGFLSGVDEFDPLFFGISPREATLIDPQERLFLQTAWEALEDAGYTPEGLRAALGGSSAIGVFAGVMWSEYQLLGLEERLKGNPVSPSSAFWSIPNRVSYTFDFHGPSLAVDTACSSSLSALHLACESIRTGECNAAIAGGVSLSLHPAKYFGLCEKRFASSDGRCRSFGDGGDGYVPGEGVGAVLLKPLSLALEHGDHIYGIVRATHVNHGGRTNGYTVPSAVGQRALVRTALDKAGISPSGISYIEAHGTGTALGDPIEIEGLATAFRTATSAPFPCAIGSLKSNIGHLESAAGIAGLTKVLLQLQHRQLAPSLHADELNTNIDFENTPFRVQRQLTDWIVPDGVPRRAGVSSFGAGGANAHVIVEEHVSVTDSGATPCTTLPQLVLLSARTPERLRIYAAKLADHLRGHAAGLSMVDVAFTLQVGRRALDARWATVASGVDELVAHLDALAQDGESDADGCWFGRAQFDAFPGPRFGTIQEDRRYLAELVENRCWERLASLWVSGLHIDWAALHPRSGRRVSLATYPFEPLRCWIPQTQSHEPVAPPQRADRVVQPAETTILCRRQIRADDPSQSDHLVAGTPILAGVASLIWAAEEARKRYPARPWAIRDVTWMRPLPVGATVEATLRLAPRAAGWHWELHTGGTSTEMAYALGDIVVEAASPPPARASIEEIRSRCPTLVTADEFYSAVAERGLNYGPTFRTLHRVHVGVREAFGELVAHEESPIVGFLDGALQTLLAIDRSAMSQGSAVPFSLQRFQLSQPLPRKGYAHARQLDANRYEVTLTDHDGAFVAHFGDICVRGRSATSNVPWIFAPSWRRRPLERLARGELGGRLLLLAPPDSTPLERALLALEQADEAWVLRLGSTLRTLGGKEEEIPATDPRAVGAWLQRRRSFDRIYHLGSLDPSDASPLDFDALEVAHQRGALTLMRLTKALVAQGSSGTLKIVTDRAHAVRRNGEIRPRFGSLTGLFKCVASELPNWNISCVDIDSRDITESTARSIVDEPPWPGGEDVAFRCGFRYGRVLIPTSLPQPAVPWREQGVYLIVGGAGGIGLALAEHLAGRVRARLLLVGRSALSETQLAKIASIEAAGAAVHYHRGDATDRAVLRDAVDEAKRRWGTLHGVIHSAIVLRDQTLERISEQDFREAFDIKARGVVALAAAVENEPLDFALLFSSAQSFMGNAGQGNYTAGSAFEDAFGAWWNSRARYPVRVVGWGYWGSVGVVATPEYRARLAAQGIASIEVPEGMAALEAILTQPLPHVLPLKASSLRLQAMGALLGERRKWLASGRDSHFDAAIEARERFPADASLSRFEEGLHALEKAARRLLLGVFQQLGVLRRPGEQLDLASIAPNLGMPPAFHRLLRALLDILSRDGSVRITAQHVEALNNSQWAEGTTFHALDEVIRNYPEVSAHANLLRECLGQYSSILQGSRKATDIIFPDASPVLVEAIYAGNPTADCMNARVAAAVAAYREAHRESPEHKPLRILELGAGTGSTTAKVLSVLREIAPNSHYVYTDISPRFVQHGERRFGRALAAMQFRTLDVEKDLEAQGVEPGTFDLVLATNVLHATRDIHSTLVRTRSLLGANGWLILNEVTAVRDYLTMTFGLLDGWWLFTDPLLRLPHAPLLGLNAWCSLLEDAGFSKILPIDDDGAETRPQLSQHVIVAESGGWQLHCSAESPRLQTEASASLGASSADPMQRAPRSPWLPPKSLPLRAAEKVPVQKRNGAHRARPAIVAALVATLGVRAEEIDQSKALRDYGVDSLVSVRLIQSLNTSLGLTLKTTVLFDYPNVRSLARHIDLELESRTANTNDAQESLVDLSHRISTPSSSDSDSQKTATMASAISPAIIQHWVEERLIESMTRALSVAPDAINRRRAFSELGVDSLTGVHLVRQVNEILGVTLPTTALFDHPSVHKLASFLCRDCSEAILAKYSVHGVSVSMDGILERLARGELSVHEAEELLSD